jgi:hypothetical protein
MGRSYKDLVAWQKSMDLVTAIYRATAGFPKDELFGLTSQLRRAAVFRFQVILPRDKVAFRKRNSGTFLDSPEALCWR